MANSEDKITTQMLKTLPANSDVLDQKLTNMGNNIIKLRKESKASRKVKT